MRQSRLSAIRLFNVATTTAEGWTAGQALRELLRRFAADWRTIPAPAWRQWGSVLLIGTIPCSLLVWMLTAIVRHFAVYGSLQRWDEHALTWIARHGPMRFSDGILFESFGNFAYLVPLTALCFILAARSRRPLLGLSFIAAYVLPRLVITLGGVLWARHRPELIAGGIAAPASTSFPSGHAALTASFYGFLAWLWVRASSSRTERAAAIFLYAALLLTVGWARVVLSAHWPTDIVAGWLVGSGSLAIVVFALKRAEHLGGR